MQTTLFAFNFLPSLHLWYERWAFSPLHWATRSEWVLPGVSCGYRWPSWTLRRYLTLILLFACSFYCLHFTWSNYSEVKLFWSQTILRRWLKYLHWKILQQKIRSILWLNVKNIITTLPTKLNITKRSFYETEHLKVLPTRLFFYYLILTCILQG